MSLSRRLSTVALAGAAVIGSCLSAAAAQAAPVAKAPTALVLGIAYGETAATVQRATTLTCAPAGGSHPFAADACRLLRAADAKLSALNVDPGPCTLEYNPVTVTLQGVWKGHLVSERATYGNPCEAQRATAAVFDF